jgi:hypothetical protein
MATQRITVTDNAWKKISDAGENGTIWLSSPSPDGDVVIDHTVNEGTDNIDPGSTVNLLINKSRFLDEADILDVLADNSTDVFYAISTDGTAEIIVDFV